LDVVRCFAICSLLFACLSTTAAAADKAVEKADKPAEKADELIKLERPKPREFILDKADLIKPADREKIKKICDKLLTEKAVPIIVVTINSMADHGGAGMRIETFARLLFDQWQIGLAKLNDQSWNRGILLLVSKNDRKARIELGADWRHDKDVLAQKIMGEQIVPKFKAGDFSGGIVAGVEALDKMARDLQLPKAAAHPSAPATWQQTALTVGLIALAVFTVVSLIRRGSGGWAWLMWGAIFAALGYLLYSFLNSQSSSSGDGGYSGGSFGGGFSGGGGATGDW